MPIIILCFRLSNLVMALAAHEINVVAGEDGAIAIEKKVYVDKETGIAAEVANVAIAVDLGDGNIGVVREQRIGLVGVNQTQTEDVSVSIMYETIKLYHTIPEQSCM